ncbi:MAG: hypothetical protein E3K37_07170 [Candidatus Kuenenia sp.]|nr:hypothetical protein [Candidatus Kuenenia hertensis]
MSKVISISPFNRVEGGKISNYQVITPTGWNASPRDENETLGAAGYIEKPFDAKIITEKIEKALGRI